MGAIILLTGGNRGIGQAIATGIVQRGQDVTLLVSSRSLPSAQSAVQQLSGTQSSVTSHPIALDVLDNASVLAAVEAIGRKYGRLDVLINNAGVASSQGDGLDEYRRSFQTTFDTNVTSVGLLVTAFEPLLSTSGDARVINVSSGRASMSALSSGSLPPTKVVSYTVSKVALNALTLELRKLYPKILFQCASPGHCSTALNNFAGTQDPLQGASVIVELATASRAAYPADFWEVVDSTVRQVSW